MTDFIFSALGFFFSMYERSPVRVFALIVSSGVMIATWAIWYILPTKRRASLRARLGWLHSVLAIILGLIIFVISAIICLPERVISPFVMVLLSWLCGIDIS